MRTKPDTRTRYITGAKSAIAVMELTGVLTATEAAGKAEPTPIRVVGGLSYPAVAIQPMAQVAKRVKRIAELDGELVKIEPEIATIGNTLYTAANPVKVAALTAGKKLVKALPFESVDEAAAWAEKNLRLTDGKNEAAALAHKREGLMSRHREIETEFLEHVHYIAVELFGEKENAALEKLAMCTPTTFSILRSI